MSLTAKGLSLKKGRPFLFVLNLSRRCFKIHPMEIKYKIWIEKDGKVVFGKGRDNILKAIRTGHSLNAAAKKLEMSYRAAWGRLKASEERMGMKLVEIDAAEKGMHLTAQAEAIIERFERLEKDVEALLADVNREFRLLIEKK
jgi:molybdate transport system regulatory protein